MNDIPTKRYLLIAGFILCLAAFLRFWNIAELEPFVDEGGNILTSLDEGVRDVIQPVFQGRPLLTYQFRTALLWPDAPVAAARATTAVAGLLTQISVGVIAFCLIGRVGSLIALGLWAILPFLVFHERLALQDPFVACFTAAAIAVAAAGSRPTASRWRDRVICLIAGILFGIGFLIKISALGALGWMGLLYLALQRRNQRKLFDLRLLMILVGAILAVLPLGSDFEDLGSSLIHFEGTTPEFEEGVSGWHHALTFAEDALGRMGKFACWYWQYNGWALGLVVFVSIAALLRSCRPGNWALAATWPLALFLSSIAYSLPYARYSHPDMVPLVVTSAAGLIFAWRSARSKPVKLLTAAIPSLCALFCFTLSARIAANPLNPPIPRDEVEQYITSDWSGNGVAATRDWLRRRALETETTCVVVTFAYWRTSCYGLMLATWNDPDIIVLPYTVESEADLPGFHRLLETQYPAPDYEIFLLFEDLLNPAPAVIANNLSRAPLVFSRSRLSGGNTLQLHHLDRRLLRIDRADTPPQTERYADGWIGPHFVETFELIGETDGLVLSGDSHPQLLSQRPRMRVFIDGREVGTFELTSATNPFHFMLSVELSPGPHELRLVSDDWFVPSELSASLDQRELFVRLNQIEIR